jgi:DNA-binding transcriptional regulator LsrR (DeoR family)
MLSPELDDYRNIPCRIIASAGTHKHAILLAVARAGLATVVVTDADSAKSHASIGNRLGKQGVVI